MQEKINKLRAFWQGLPTEHLVTVLIIVFSTTAAFGLGRLSIAETPRSPIRIEYSTSTVASIGEALSVPTITPFPVKGTATVSKKPAPTATGPIFASKTGKKYYFPNCSGGNRVKLENRVYFQSEKEAQAFGLTIATNCYPPK